MKKIKQEEPYLECSECQSIEDCPHPDVDQDGFGTPMCPDVCLRPMDIMKLTEKRRKLKRTSRN